MALDTGDESVASFAIRSEQVAVQRIVAVLEERTGATVATLGDVARMTVDDNTGKTGHAATCPAKRAASIECTVTVINSKAAPASRSRPEAETGSLIHHSDRGVQYACIANGSRSRNGNAS
ncbi:hypothetical protein [Bradyrhizobium sp. McL0616]|uniref:hypothetical protein n=1 Tax=Bradyrhizobium sp. McL0616 TaxID=3415674 RepID=UPI003CF44C06